MGGFRGLEKPLQLGLDRDIGLESDRSPAALADRGDYLLGISGV